MPQATVYDTEVVSKYGYYRSSATDSTSGCAATRKAPILSIIAQQLSQINADSDYRSHIITHIL